MIEAFDQFIEYRITGNALTQCKAFLHAKVYQVKDGIVKYFVSITVRNRSGWTCQTVFD